MPAFVRRLFDRIADKVDRSAAGTSVPAGVDPPDPSARPRPTARERTLMRRRLRTLRHRRDALMREAGGELLEARRGQATGSPALDRAVAELEQVDAEARAIAKALDELKTLDDLVAGGVAARCTACGELVASRDGYCASCGAALKGGRERRPADSEPSDGARTPARVGGAPNATTTTTSS